MNAKIEFCPVPVGLPATSIVIRDIGVIEGRPSISQDAYEVVATMLRLVVQMGEAVGGAGIFYYSSQGSLHQLVHDGIEFTGQILPVQLEATHGRN